MITDMRKDAWLCSKEMGPESSLELPNPRDSVCAQRNGGMSKDDPLQEVQLVEYG